MAHNLFIRSLLKCGQEISVLHRTLDGSDYDTSQPAEAFTEIATPTSIVKTISTGIRSGDKIFDGIQIVENTTHVFCMIHTATLDPVEYQNYFVDLNGDRYKILAVTNIDERDEVIAIQACKRGDDTLEAAEA